MTSESTMISVKNHEHHHTCQQIVVHVVNQLLAVKYILWEHFNSTPHSQVVSTPNLGVSLKFTKEAMHTALSSRGFETQAHSSED